MVVYFPTYFWFLYRHRNPLAFAKLGAVKVTVLLVAAQMVTSVVWDIFVEDIGVNMMKFAGIVCALVSVILITLSKN